MSQRVFLDLFPLVVVRGASNATDEQIEQMLEGQARAYESGEKSVWISMLPSGTKVTREQSRRVGAWMKEFAPKTRELNMGIAFVTSSKTFRFLLSALFLLQTLESPYEIFTDLEKACDYVDGQAKKGGVKLPADWRARFKALAERERLSSTADPQPATP